MDNTIIRVDEIPRVEWRNERVMTTAQLAEFYETSEGNLRVNFFNAQKEGRFIDGKHFFKLEGDDLQNLRVTNCYLQISEMTRVLYLWTKRGAARHAKMLNTDRAWEVFELLEDAYFNRAAEDNSTLPGADFWWEVKRPHKPTDFERGVQLKKLSSHTHNPETRELLIREAANLIAGERIFTV